jgi:iron complex transport system substrate-binding protein
MRVVSLCPSLTETVFALGRGDTLVGRTKFCVHPKDQVTRVERVGGTKNPKIARIVALAPDLVLMNDEENRREDAEALAAAGVRTLSTFPRDPAGAAEAVRVIGRALAASDAANRLADAIDARAAQVRARARRKVRFAYLIWRAPWMAVAGDTYISGLLAVAGGENLFAARTPRYPPIEPAELAGAERVFLSSEPFPFADKHADELAAVTSLPRACFERVDGERLSWHGARTLAGLDYAEELLSAQP